MEKWQRLMSLETWVASVTYYFGCGLSPLLLSKVKKKKSRNLLKFTQRVRRSIIKLTTMTSDPYGVYEDPKNIDGAPLENIICRSHIVFIFPALFLRALIDLICMQII